MTTLYNQTNTLFQAGSGNTIGATSVVLTTLTDIYGNVLTMSNFGSKGYGTCEPDTNNEEGFTFTGITANGNGTYSLTGVSTILASSPYTETSGLIRQHAGGTKVVITDNVAFWNTFVNKNNTATINAIHTFATGATPLVTDQPTTNLQVANKLYVDTVTINGAPDASTTTKGITKLSTAPVSPTNPIAVGDNDARVANPLTVAYGGTGLQTLTAHSLQVGNGTSAVTQLGLGTTVTVLHGNASGDPTFGAVVLTTDVSGILPVANGGTGSATLPFLGLFKNGTTTKNLADASTTQNIAHGLGVIPKFVRVTFSFTSPAFGVLVYNGTTASANGQALSNGSYRDMSGTNIILYELGNNTQFQTGVITFDATNIILTWTKTNSPTGTYTIMWEAFS